MSAGEILPPDPLQRARLEIEHEATAISRAFSELERRMPGVPNDRSQPPNGNVPSGTWWCFVDGLAGTMGSITVNGQTLLYSRGIWQVLDNFRFQALYNSHEMMWWMDRHQLMEKTIADITGEIGERPYIGRGASREAPRHDQSAAPLLRSPAPRLPAADDTGSV